MNIGFLLGSHCPPLTSTYLFAPFLTSYDRSWVTYRHCLSGFRGYSFSCHFHFPVFPTRLILFSCSGWSRPYFMDCFALTRPSACSGPRTPIRGPSHANFQGRRILFRATSFSVRVNFNFFILRFDFRISILSGFSRGSPASSSGEARFLSQHLAFHFPHFLSST